MLWVSAGTTRAGKITDSTRRSAGEVRSSESPVAGAISRDRAIVATCISIVVALAWAYLFRLDRQMGSHESALGAMRGMSMLPGAFRSFSSLFLTFAMWSAMMVGMMTASAAPVIMLFTGMSEKRGDPRASTNAIVFGLGYLTVWLSFSAAAALGQWGLQRELLLSPELWVKSSIAAGLILIAAGIYQLTPAKRACLKQCQSPLGFLLANWRDGTAGAFEMGLRHGLFCLGCCWALMTVLFVVGIMNLVWVAMLTAFVLAEKFGRIGALVARAGSVVMIGFGAIILTI
jgi:predicted metal-binding membrane protein